MFISLFLFSNAFAAPMSAEDAIKFASEVESGRQPKWSQEAFVPGAKPKTRPILSKKNKKDLFKGMEKSVEFKSDGLSNFVDLRQFDSGIRNQGSRGWCTSFATVATIENLWNQKIPQQAAVAKLNLSEAHLWSMYKQYSMYDSTAAATKNFITSESAWPYYGKPGVNYLNYARNKYSGRISLNSISSAISTLEKKIPIVFGVDTTPYWGNPNKGYIPIAGTVEGGHAIAIVGYIKDQKAPGGGLFIFKNSWSKTWGDEGYGYLPFGYCAKYECYFIAPTGVITK